MLKELKRYWWVFAIVVLLWGGYFTFIIINPVKLDSDGQFGDAFGALNTLFSGLAFVGLIIAIFLQREDLKIQSEAFKKQTEEVKLQNDVLDLQRQELADTRGVLEQQREQFQAQSDIMSRQAFENTFFQLLNLHHEIVNAMSSSGIHDKGRAYFYYLYNNELRSTFSRANTKLNNHSVLAIIEQGYDWFYSSHQTRVGHYFRNLYNIVKFVKNSDVSNKRLYTNIIRAQLSSSELGLLFYNCLYKENIKFKVLIEEFALLKNLPEDILFNPPDHKVLYEKSAYGSS